MIRRWIAQTMLVSLAAGIALAPTPATADPTRSESYEAADNGSREGTRYMSFYSLPGDPDFAVGQRLTEQQVQDLYGYTATDIQRYASTAPDDGYDIASEGFEPESGEDFSVDAYEAETNSGTAAGPPANQGDLIDNWTGKNGEEIELRRGWVNKKTGEGFAWNKIVYKHNLTTSFVKRSTRIYDRKLQGKSPTFYRYFFKVNQMGCNSKGTNCVIIAQAPVKIFVEERAKQRAWKGGSMYGVVTAYCEMGKDPKNPLYWPCPNWVKTAKLHGEK